MKKTFAIKPKQTLTSLIRGGKFYAKNETNQLLNFSEKDPYASCFGFSIGNEAEKNLIIQ